VLLVHGFGASSGHWRHTIPALAGDAEVLAVDLLGFGASDKPRSCLPGESPGPGSVRYCFDLWAELVADLALEAGSTNHQRLHLVGNSIGGIVALTAALLLRQRRQPPHQVVLIDCAQRALDDKLLAEQPALARAGRPALKQLVRQRWLLAPLFRLLAQPRFIRQVLAQAYPSGAHVDKELVNLLHRPSTDPGAIESFRGFVNLFNDHLAPQLLADLSEPLGDIRAAVPVRMLWGEQDPWEDPAQARDWAGRFSCVQALEVLPGVGHCPHDEAPELVNPILRRWILDHQG
jgi:Predicted hydrolases or acyltransferases (alpha/beta hydrolase superfamily)